MTWGPGQGTAVHDHGGLWCVEGVVDGEIAVTQYLVQQETDGYFRVTPIGSLLAGTRLAPGCLIPPTDHHVLANARPSKASVTLHVYGGDLDDCKVFLPATPDGRYEETTTMLSVYTNERRLHRSQFPRQPARDRHRAAQRAPTASR